MKRLILLLLFATGAYGQSLYRYENILLNQNGQPLTGVNVYVCTGQVTPNYAGTPPCPLATIYNDAGVPITQPTTTSPLGNYAFLLPGGLPYTVVFLGPLITGSDLITPPLFPGVNPTGNNTFTGSNSFQSINGIIYADQQAGSTADVKINNCLAAIPATGGTCDARGLMGAQTIASTITLGTAAGKASTLILGTGVTYTVTITNNTPAFLMYDSTSLVSSGHGVNTCRIVPGNGAIVSELVKNGPDTFFGGTTHILISGVQFDGNASATVSNSLVNFTGLYDSEFFDLAVTPKGTIGLWIHDLSAPIGVFDLNFSNLLLDGGHVASSRPLVIEQTNAPTGGGGTGQITFYGGDWGHPGAANYLVEINGHAHVSGLVGVSMNGIHMEGNNTAGDSAAIVRIDDAANVSIYGGTIYGLSSGSTQAGVDIAETAVNTTNNVVISGTRTGINPLVNDTINGGKQSITASNSIGFYQFNSPDGSTTDISMIGGVSFGLRGALQPSSSTVVGLPSAASQPGAMFYVTDSTTISAEGQTCAGSSNVKALAFSNGSVWKCF